MKVEASIVSLGSWNSRIFTPTWVSDKVFAMPEGDSMNVGLNDQQMSLTYLWKNIQLLITDSRIEFKTNQCTSEILTLMEQCYLRLSEFLPYTPVTAVGFNLNFNLTKEEFQQASVSKLQMPKPIGDYNCNTLTYSANKDNANRSFVILQTAEGGGEIRINFHYPRPNQLPAGGTSFELIASEMKQFLGYEYSIK